MLPHTPDRHAVLTGVARILGNEGVLIIVVPSPLWKLFKLAAFYPRLILRFLRRRRGRVANGEQTIPGKADRPANPNNPKAPRKHSWFRQVLFPLPIGVYSSNTAELFGSRKRIWTEQFRKAGWELISVRTGPFICADLNRGLNDVFARLGLCTEYIYIAKKAGQSSRYEAFFR
jgi:hypothetical protein